MRHRSKTAADQRWCWFEAAADASGAKFDTVEGDSVASLVHSERRRRV